MEKEITQQARPTDPYLTLKSTTVCGYNFGSCTVTITQCRSICFTPHFCHGSHTGEKSSSCYWFAHLYHHFTYHIKITCSEAENTQQILLADSSFIFVFQCTIKSCQAHTDSVQNHFPMFCIALLITFNIAFLASVILSQADGLQFSIIGFHMLSILLVGPTVLQLFKNKCNSDKYVIPFCYSKKVDSIYF